MNVYLSAESKHAVRVIITNQIRKAKVSFLDLLEIEVDCKPEVFVKSGDDIRLQVPLKKHIRFARISYRDKDGVELLWYQLDVIPGDKIKTHVPTPKDLCLI
jgi:hypothetical protein